ncbi:MAG TPA: energy transducer TonB [Steroidobacteraceae bacterium]|nr:energy transducer TonB [Steroidobacteraceae bacterium]
MSAGSRLDRPDDRLATAVFVAALLHGLVILGVRFSTAPADDRALPTLEVLLVPEGASEAANPTATYIAQRSQRGSGTGLERERTSLPESSASVVPSSGLPEGQSYLSEPKEAAAGGTPVLTAHRLDASRAVAGDVAPDASEAPTAPVESRPQPEIGANATAADQQLRLRGQPSADDSLRADTRESAIAGYLDGWKRHIERVGTINFPNEARRRALSGNPVLEVAIRADGSLEAVIVRRSSGHRELDNAAVGIVRLAAPFDPFPPAMRERYPTLRFAYEWQFLNGRLGSGEVFSDGP